MKAEIKLVGNVDEEDSYALSDLAILLEQECDALVEQERQSVEGGVKDGGLVIALTVVGLALSAISTLVSVLSYWESKQKAEQVKYSVSIVIGNKTFTLENLKPEQVESELARFKAGEEAIQVQVLRQ
ncbi:hypothetical protein NDI52_17755 [Leptolyngbya sp. PL-A3]|uniref:hypothetical protein n=1 Tax=Leptolyngbya sp. PL-A3 TaxID=2933911 RepID=UPI0017464251|nr:hypothetical protein [Phormidium tenue FACHB-886]